MRILGVDPGLANTGWSVVDCERQRYRPVSFGVITTGSSEPIDRRIFTIASSVKKIASDNGCVFCAMEEIFFSKNISSAISVAKVIGAITFAMGELEIGVRLFTPPQIKQAVVGTGSADKRQIEEMVRLLMGLKELPKPDHAADSLAAVVTFATFYETERRILG